MVTHEKLEEKKLQKRVHEEEKGDENFGTWRSQKWHKKGRHSALAQIAPARSPSRNSLPRATG